MGGASSSHGDTLGQGMVAGIEEHADTIDEEVKGDDEEGEEGRELVRLMAPLNVSQEEREAHELTHTPYRFSCKHCVRARGRITRHTRVTDAARRSIAHNVRLQGRFV